MKLFLLLTVLFQVYPAVWPSATVQFKFHSFSNPDHRELDGDCCDDIIGGCDDFCDNYFKLCIDKDFTSGSDFEQCDIASLTTGIFNNNDVFNFPAVVPAANPLTMTRTSWTGGMRVKLQVWDSDGNADDKVDEDYRNINQAASRTLSSATWVQYTQGQQSVFTYKVRVYCNSNYYSSDCSVYCYPMDNQNGHYSCDLTTGAKNCYSGWEGPNCNVDVNDCQASPCVNGAVCTDTGTNRYTCQCANGFSGTNCEINVNECASNPCKNGGICNDHVASFSCSCLPGHVYADEFCEYDDCASQPCHNGATCYDRIGHFQCSCPLGYYGDQCELDIDYCMNITCVNNGTCVDRIDGFHCLCQTGFEGILCDVETDECASQPCMHNSTCHDFIGRYVCTCRTGYQGSNCEEEIDECLSYPCMNNATCHDVFDGFRCECADGFEGALCETDIDECASGPCFSNETCMDEVNGYRCLRVNQCDYNPCQNNATCIDDYPGFICMCTDGYEGKTCSSDIDECESSPCLHGTCVDHLNAFSCVCSPGFAGEMCNSETNECSSSPCDLEHGVCVDQINGFYCNCAPGYSGELCQNNTDECASAPCQHGRCVDDINGYLCECIISCINGHCFNGVCYCNDGYDGDDCSVQMDYCSSSPCSYGTCIPSLNAYRCECDSLFTGVNCNIIVEDPCFFAPCDRGTCKETGGDDINYECTCDPGFAGKNCDADINLNGATITIEGKLDDRSEFEQRMANVLQKLISSSSRVLRDTDSDTVFVEVVMAEDYEKSTDGGALTKVTFIAWTDAGYLSKDFINEMIGSPKGSRPDLGYQVYDGKSKPLTSGGNDGNWIGSNWYVLLLVVGVVGVLVLGGYITWRKGHTSLGKNPFRAPRQPAGLPPLDPPEASYSTRISNDFTTLVSDTPAGRNISTIESVNPAYIPSCLSVDLPFEEAFGSGCCEDGMGAQGERVTSMRVSNIYDEIPAFKGEATAEENPYAFMK